MSQRLVRAKTKIRDARIPFRIPDPPEWAERLSFVLDAIYSAFTAGSEPPADDLAPDAIALARLTASLLPAEPEALGLAALLLHVEARRPARRTPAGAFIPLDRQDPALWSRPLIEEAEAYLRTAATQAQSGRFQLEAAIQSIHADRARTGRIDWPQIALLYEGLTRLSPGIGAHIGRAVALAEAGHLAPAAEALEALPAPRVATHAPYWAARGHISHLSGDPTAARAAFTRAASLSTDPAWRAYLLDRAATGRP